MKPMAGITVLEFSTMVTGSLAAMMLAEQGARVIKIEPLHLGDPMRYLGSRKGDISALFANCNRGKESVRVDIKSDAGQALIHDLIPKVDVLIHNFRPGSMDALNLGSDQLRSINPKLVFCAISGFGAEGPMQRSPAYDPTVQAFAGLAAVQGSDEEPAFFRTLMCDKITAYTACQAVTAALFNRERLGEGTHIDLSMLDASLFFVFPDGYQNHTLLDEHEQQGLLIDNLYRLIQTKDGAVTISAGSADQQLRFLSALNQAHLLEDERFNTFEKQLKNRGQLLDLIAEDCLQYTSDELIALLRKAEVPCAKCLTRDEALASEQLAANDSTAIIEHPHLGKVRIVKAPPRFGGKRLEPSGFVPRHGEHSLSALADLDIDRARIDELRQAGIVS